MPDRFYDEEDKYTEGFLKEYEYWNLEISYRQHSPGCCIIFCKRQGVTGLTELTDEEIVEFKSVCKEMEEALLANELFKPDRFNYLQLGNRVHHLHIHAIPRYSEPREFLGRVWEDPKFETVAMWQREDESHETVRAFRDEVLKYLDE